MKKIVFTLALCIFIIADIHSQIINSQSIDSLRQIIDQQKDDRTKVDLLASYSFYIVFTAPEEALAFAQEGLLLANSLNYQKGQILCNIFVGHSKWVQGDYIESTNLLLQSLKEAESIKDTSLYGRALDGLVGSYRDHGNYREALKYSFKGIRMFEKNSYVKVWTGSIYNAMKMPDSALYYFLPIDKTFGRQFYGYTLLEIGKSYHQKKEYAQALSYYKNSIDTLETSRNIKDLALAHNGIAELYADMGKLDSCIYFAKQGLVISEKGSHKKGVYESYLLLSEAFESKNKAEALKYYKLAMEVKDEIYNTMDQTRAMSARFANQLQQIELEKQEVNNAIRTRKIVFLIILIVSVIIILLLYRNIRIKQKAKNKIEKAYSRLKDTQHQLIQSEKMASLGELTAGIAHEIQNPLNFVNNFSEVSEELIEELKEEIKNDSKEDIEEILKSLNQNLGKINHHGQRASSIVKSMLDHSRKSKGVKELTDINVLADEYLRLSYHGLRAKDRTFSADFKTELDKTIPKINIVPQDFGRVILNLINNAFYAVSEKGKSAKDDYQPTVTVSTKLANKNIQISVKDNGNGIPKELMDKIFQPFFTTKPTGEGTGLGLSLAYDIITKGHGGTITVDSKRGNYTKLTIILPIKST